jgi:hypothetical protein
MKTTFAKKECSSLCGYIFIKQRKLSMCFSKVETEASVVYSESNVDTIIEILQ